MPGCGRLAPTPSGRVHLGNALSFAMAWLSSRASGAELVLRIEDVDTTRARPDLVAAIREDLAWLGLGYDRELPAQSVRTYAPFLEGLDTFHCLCTRSLLKLRPCSCGEHDIDHGAVRWRMPPGVVDFVDRRLGAQRFDPASHGQPVLVRRDGIATYLLAVVVDDLRDGVTEVVRGADLLSFTAVQIRLWQALGATPPTWLHAPLLLGPDGRKLSKSHGSTEIASLRQQGHQPHDVWTRLLPLLGFPRARSLTEALDVCGTRGFDPTAGEPGPVVLD